MKKLFILFVSVLLAGCGEYQPTIHHLSLIVDLTEGDSYRPSPREVLDHLPDMDTSDGLELSIRYVAETRYAPSQLFSMAEGETGWRSNEDQRRRKYKYLLKQFSDTLLAMNRTQGALPRSEIFQLVAQEVNRLSLEKGTGTVLLSSDLMENGKLFSVYDPRQVKRLLNDANAVKASFENAAPLEGDLSGITLIILHRPSLEEDGLFTAMLGLYRAILEPRGARVVTGNVKTVKI